MHRVLSVLLVAAVLATGCSVLDRVERAIPRRPPKGVDLNTAAPEQIADLPGLTDADAERIVRDRPYETKEQVVQRGIVSQETFAKFADRIYVSQPTQPGPAPGPVARVPARGSAGAVAGD